MTRYNHPGRRPFGHSHTMPEYDEPCIPVALSAIGSCSKFTQDESGPFIIHTAYLSDDHPFADRGPMLTVLAEKLNEDLCALHPGSKLIVQDGRVCLNRTILRNNATEADAVMGTLEIFHRFINQLDDDLDAWAHADADEDTEEASFHRPPRASAYAGSFAHDAFDEEPEADNDDLEFEIPPVPPHFHGRHADMHAGGDIPHNACEDEPGYGESEYDAPEAHAPEAAPDAPEFEYDDHSAFDAPIIVSCKIPCGMTELIIPDHVAGFGPKALCCLDSVTRISLPASIQQIGEHDFDLLPNLVDIEIRDSENSAFESIDGVLYRKGRLHELVRYGAGREAHQFRVPEGVTIIGRRAFAANRFLEYVVLPESVWDVHDSAFACCPSLEYAQFANTDTVYIREHAFSGCPSLLYVHLVCDELDIGERAFEHCAELFNITLTGHVTLESHAFNGCASLGNVTLSGSLKRADHALFAGCRSDLKIHCSKDSAALIPEYRDRIILIAAQE